MSGRAKIGRIWFLAAAVILAAMGAVNLAAPVIARLNVRLQQGNEPSTFFTALDRNADAALDLDEWMAEYNNHPHDWMRCAGKDFEPADCDGYLKLTWPEYYSYRFENEWCVPVTPYLTNYQKPAVDPGMGQYQLMPSCQARMVESNGMSQSGVLDSGAASPACD